MKKDFLRGIYAGLGFIFIVSLIAGVFAVGFHYANEILPGVFSGNFTFDGNVNITSGNDLCINGGNCLSKSDSRWSNNSDDIYYIDGNVGVGTNNPTAKLQVIGKIVSSPTQSSDDDNTLVTKSYVDDTGIYTTCGWRDGKMCDSGELLNGYSNSQVYCCGTNDITCTPTLWSTYNTICTPNYGCGGDCKYISGTELLQQSRVMSNCLVEYRSISGSSCSYYCSDCDPR